MADGRVLRKYQAILLDNLANYRYLKHSHLLTDSDGDSDLQHDCLEIIDYIYFSILDLLGQPLTKPDWELYTDGSSFTEDGQQ